MIFPKRLVFSGSQRVYDLNLANTGEDTARYNISLVQIRMKEDGGFEDITQPDSGQYFADSYLRFFPRSVVLAPKESQTVKVQLIRTDQMKPGEYRSHLYFRAVSIDKPLTIGYNEKVKDTANAISVRILPIFGITIPVIIRSGESTTKVTISDISFIMKNDSTPTLSMTVNRIGNMSVYGDINVDYISPEGKVTPVLFIQGVAVYTPNRLRRSVLNLDNTMNVDYRRGKLYLKYTSPMDNKNVMLAEAEFILK